MEPLDRKDLQFSFENKENQSINYNEFSPSRITANGNMVLDISQSPRSNSSPVQLGGHESAQKHHYFIDKGNMLKRLSPTKDE
jgi:hypothetical protein